MQGTTLGPYRIEKELGSGGMGTVHLARVVGPAPGLAEGTRVALKLLHPHLLGSPGIFQRFLREAEIGRKIRHPNLVRTLGADALFIEDRHHHFLVMEYVEGQTLRDLVEELRRVPEELCLHIGREVSKGLAAIHEAGAVHRDLKPENVLLTPGHEVKIMDLGVALLNEEAVRLSRTGMFVGSLQYASPEQLGGESGIVDGRTDLHGLGLLLHELATGEQPFAGEEISRVVAMVLTTTPRRIGELSPQVSPFFEEVVHALLQKDRERRPRDAKLLFETLRDGEDSEWWVTRARSLRAATRRPLRRIALPRETGVFGREKELERLGERHERAREGEGQVVLLEGEAGIGKTRLVDEFVARLSADGQDFDFLFGSYPPGGAATSAGAFVDAFREYFGPDDAEPELRLYLERSPDLAAAFAALLAGDSPPPDAVPLTRETLRTAFVHTIRALAARRPVLLFIDDLHFTTAEGRGLFAALAQAAQGHRVLLLGSCRPGLPSEWLSELDRLDAFTRISLDRLGPRDLSDLLVGAFASEKLAVRLCLPIAKKSDGNPFFAIEIIRDMKERGLLAEGPDGSWASTEEIVEIEVPSNVRELLRTRISGLEEEEREILDVAACDGFEFDGALVADAMGLKRVPALRRLAHIEGKHRLVRARGRRFVFDHHQVQEILYEAMPEMLREEYHELLAETLLDRAGGAPPEGETAVRICGHRLDGTSPAAAAAEIAPALEHLEREYRIEAAAELGLRLLAVPGAVSGRARLALILRTIPHLNTLGQRREEKELLAEAEALSTEIEDPSLSAKLLAARGWSLVGDAKYEEARRALEGAVARARDAGDRRREGRASGDLGIALFLLGRYEDARERHEASLAVAKEAEDARGICNATGNLGNVLYALGRYDDAEAQYERWLAMSRDIGSRRGAAAAIANLGAIRGLRGRHAEARELQEENRALCREIGYRAGEARATGAIADTLQALGRYSEAVEELERYLELSREAGHVLGEAMARLSLSELLTTLGDAEAGADHLARAEGIAEETGSPGLLAETRHARGRVAALLGRREEAADHYRRALDMRRKMGEPAPVATLLVELGALLLDLGDAAGARPLLEEASRLARDLDLAGPGARAGALRLREADADPGAEGERFRELEARLSHGVKMEVRYRLWRATGDAEHLSEARRLLGERMDQVPEPRLPAALEIPLHRAIHESRGG